MIAALVWTALAVAVVVTELRWANRRRLAASAAPPGAPLAAARASDEGLQACFVLALAGPVLSAVALGWRTGPVWVSLGGLLGASGVVLRVGAMRALGGRYMLRLSEQPDDPRLVRDGCYAVVRHPGYTALVLAAIGLGLVAAGPAAIVWSLPTLGLVAVRIRVEERMLVREFGAGYEEYRRAVPGRLVPHVW